MVLRVVFVLVPVIVVLGIIRKYKEYSWGKCKEKGSLNGRVFLVTGGNSGIGKETVKELVSRKAKVIVACRDLQKAKLTITEIRKTVSTGELIPMHVDLASLKSVKAFAEEVLRDFPEIHCLINNAGVFLPENKHEKTKDGFEIHFGVNHLSHFLLTTLLLERLKKSAPSSKKVYPEEKEEEAVEYGPYVSVVRPVQFYEGDSDYWYESSSSSSIEALDQDWIYETDWTSEDDALRPYDGPLDDEDWIIIVSSTLHQRGVIDFDNLNGEKGLQHQMKSPNPGYSNSKLANAYFAMELARRTAGSGVEVFPLCPGFCYTGLVRNMEIKWYQYITFFPVLLLFMRTANQGYQTVLHCALSKSVVGNSGQFYRDCQLYKSTHDFQPEVATKLWAVSEELVSNTLKT